MNKSESPVILIAGILITFSIIGSVFYVLFRSIYQGTSKLESNTDVIQGKSISRRQLVFGNPFVDCYFDEEYLYVVQSGAKAKFPLKNITEIKDTAVNVSGGRIWQIKVTDEQGQKMQFKFVPNATILNSKDFLDFLETVKKIDSSVVKSEWKWWKK